MKVPTRNRDTNNIQSSIREKGGGGPVKKEKTGISESMSQKKEKGLFIKAEKAGLKGGKWVSRGGGKKRHEKENDFRKRRVRKEVGTKKRKGTL